MEENKTICFFTLVWFWEERSMDERRVGRRLGASKVRGSFFSSCVEFPFGRFVAGRYRSGAGKRKIERKKKKIRLALVGLLFRLDPYVF